MLFRPGSTREILTSFHMFAWLAHRPSWKTYHNPAFASFVPLSLSTRSKWKHYQMQKVSHAKTRWRDGCQYVCKVQVSQLIPFYFPSLLALNKPVAVTNCIAPQVATNSLTVCYAVAKSDLEVSIRNGWKYSNAVQQVVRFLTKGWLRTNRSCHLRYVTCTACLKLESQQYRNNR